jgi:tetratricopeptide (TPR) repeat protein
MTTQLSLRLLVGCAALTVLTACSSKADRLQSGLSKSAEFVKLADWDKANVEVRNVLQIDPKNAQAYFIAGQIAEGKSEIQRAFASYSKAVELDPAQLDAKVALARIHLLAGEPDKAQSAIADVLAASAKHVGARAIQAALDARNGDVPGAIAQARALLDERKGASVEAAMLLAGLYANQGDAASALQTIERALQADDKNLGLLRVAAQIASASSAPDVQDKAVAFFRRATEQAPRSSELWNAWAGYHLQHQELDRAQEVLRAALKAQPDDSQRQLALLDFLAAHRGRDVAEKAFLAAIADKPKDMALRFALVNLYRAADRPADARRVLQEIADNSQDAPGLAAKGQLAADLLARGNARQARALVDAILAASPRDGTALVLRGRMQLADGDARSAIIDLRAAAKDQPGSAEITALLAQAHRRAGEPQLAREVIAEAVKFNPEKADLRLLLAADQADAKEYQAADAGVDAVLKANPGDLRAHDMKARLALARNDSAGAEKVYASLKARFPADPTGAMKLGQFYASQKKLDAALREYDAATRIAPGAPGPVMGATTLLIGQRRFDEAAQRIDALVQREPKSLIAQQLRGELALARGDLAQAEQAYLQFIAFAPGVATGYLSLARVKAQRGNVDEVLAVLEQGEKANPADLSLVSARAEWLTRAGRKAEAIALYESLLKRSADDDAYANNLAYLLTDSKTDKASLERALALLQRFKDSSNSAYLDSLGWTHYKLGQYDPAVAALERAVQIKADSPLLQLHLGLALYKKGDAPRAQDLLKKALASKAALPDLDEARQILAQR